MHTGFWFERDHLVDRGIDSRILLKCILVTKSLRLNLIHVMHSLSVGLDLKVTIYYTRLDTTSYLVFAAVGCSIVCYVWEHNSLFSEEI